jgi:hypothetical protein
VSIASTVVNDEGRQKSPLRPAYRSEPYQKYRCNEKRKLASPMTLEMAGAFTI